MQTMKQLIAKMGLDEKAEIRKLKARMRYAVKASNQSRHPADSYGSGAESTRAFVREFERINHLKATT